MSTFLRTALTARNGDVRRFAGGAHRAICGILAPAAVVAVLGALPAVSADWGFDPRVAVSAEYDDNVRMTEVPGDEVEVAGAAVDAQLRVQARSPTSTFSVTPRLRSTFYPDDPDEEANDQFLAVAMSHEAQRSRSSLEMDYSRVVTLGTYFPSSAIGDDDVLGEPPPGVGVGRSVARNREERFEVVPAVAFDLGELDSLELRATYLDVTYDENVQGEREDYADITGAVAWRHQTSPTANLTLRGSYSRFEPDEGDNSDVYGIDAEWSNRVSDTAQVFVRGGVDRIRVDSPDDLAGGDWEEGFTGGAGVRWQFAVTRVFVDAGRYLDPNASGEVVSRDQLRAQWSRRLGEMTTVFVGARIIHDSSATDDSEFTDREYATGRVGLEWRFAREWSLFGDYNYAWREYDNALNDAESNTVSLGVVYEPNRGNR